MDFKRLEMSSASHSDSTLEALRELVPGAFTETREPSGDLTYRVDWDQLRELLGDTIRESDEETYGFLWVGKQEAKRAAAKPTRQTLRPVLEESVDWDTTENLYIEGDNLEVLKLLQRAYLGRVKMIYIDPPYNTGKEFVYEDNFAMSREEEDELMGNVDEENRRLRGNPKTESRYHSDWCSMIYSRLLVARTLLANDGVIFISIDDNEVHHLRCICDEVFGASNFVGMLIWKSTPGSNTGEGLKNVTEYILLYAKDVSQCRISTLKNIDEEKYVLEDEYVADRGKFLLNKLDRRMTGVHYSDALFYPIEAPDGSLIYPGGKNEKDGNWNFRWSKKKVEWGLESGFITFKKNSVGEWSVYFKQYLYVDNNNRRITRSLPRQNLLNITGASSATGTKEVMDLFSRKIFDYPKPLSLIKDIVSHIEDPDSLILDFFSGSATTAHAVMQLNAEDGGHRKYIMVQLREETPEDSEARRAGYDTICEIGKERIRRAGRKIREEYALQADELDTGFRVLSLDSSNMQDVYFEPSEVTQDKLFAQEEDLVKPGRTELDLLFGCMVDWGVQLSFPMRMELVEGKRLYVVNEGGLVACFDRDITLETIRHMAALAPERVIFRESCFTSDADKLNVYELFKQQCGWSEEEVYRNVYVL